MKKRLLLTLFVFPILIYSQNIVDMPIHNNCSPNIDTIINPKPYFLRVNIDTLFIINKASLKNYINCVQDYNQLSKIKELSLNASKQNNSTTTKFTEYSNKTNLHNYQYKNEIEQNIKRYELLKKQNIELKSKLTKTKKNLNEAEQDIKIHKKKSKISKWLWGAGGVIVGLATAILISA